jgi:hypothetical protein
MTTRKHKLGLRHRPVPEKIATCGNLVAGLRRLPAELRQLVYLDEFQEAHTEAEAAQREVELVRCQLASALAARQQKTKKLERAAHRSADAYSLRVNSEEDLSAVGLRLEAAKSSIGLPSAPTQLRSLPAGGEATGTVKLRWKRPVRHCFHVVEVTDDVNRKTGWKRVTQCGRASCMARGLKPGELYWFRVAAETATGLGPWSELRARASH